MANSRTTKTGRRAKRSASTGGLPWVSELQLNAYLEARDALRRAHATALLSIVDPPPRRKSAH
jgi:hypothetical protein